MSDDKQLIQTAEAAEPQAKTTLDINDIQRILPHRYPFLLIDRVIELTRKQRIVALKNVTVNEPFFAGHFPGRPIMPGVLIVEAMAQAGGVLFMIEFDDRDKKIVVFTGIDGAKFRRQVLPGDQLRIEVIVEKFRRSGRHAAGRMKGYAYVGDKLATEATISCHLVDLDSGASGQDNGGTGGE